LIWDYGDDVVIEVNYRRPALPGGQGRSPAATIPELPKPDSNAQVQPLPPIRIATPAGYPVQVPTEHTVLGQKSTRIKFGYINKAGKMIIPARYAFAYPFHEGLAVVQTSPTQWICIDARGRPLRISGAQPTRVGVGEGMIPVAAWKDHGNQIGFANRTGKIVVPPQYLAVGGFSEGLAPVRGRKRPVQNKVGYIDKMGTLVIPMRYKDGTPFREGLAGVSDSTGAGYVDKTGAVVIPMKFSSTSAFSCGRARVLSGGKFVFIDKRGSVLPMPSAVNMVHDFHEGLARVQREGKSGFIDPGMSIAIPPQYDDARDFSEGLAAVRVGGKWGYIDRSGKMVIPPRFLRAEPFRGGLAVVDTSQRLFAYWNKGTHYIDRVGRRIWPRGNGK